MTEGNSKPGEFSLERGFGVVVRVNDARVEIHADRRIVVYTNDGIDVYANAPVHVHAAANDEALPGAGTAPKPYYGMPPSTPGSRPKPKARAAPEIGDAMEDGTILAGISPDTQKPIYATPADAPLTYTFNEAAEFAKKLNRERYLGHDDWRVPTKGELDVLFNNLAAIGGFDVTGSNPAGWYWSSSQVSTNIAWAQRFSDGYQNDIFKGHDSSLRCVR